MRASGNSLLRNNRRYLALLVVLVLALYVVIPQLAEFRSSWRLLRHPFTFWVIVATVLTMLTYLAAAATYCLLAFKRLRYGQTVIIELAAMFINRLLPAGIGALGTNYTYLRRMGHNAAQATTIVGVNNLLGILGHMLILAVALAISPSSSLTTSHRQYSHTELYWFVALGALAVVLLAIAGAKRRLRRPILKVLRQIVSYRTRPKRLGAGLISSMTLTICNVLCLGCCCLAFGVHLAFVSVLLILSFGLGAGTLTPTPGGLGGFEAGLTAALIVYRVDSPTALTVALLYRLISYWLPLVVGAPALVVAQKRRLLLRNTG